METRKNIDDLHTHVNTLKLDFELYQLGKIYDVDIPHTNNINIYQTITSIQETENLINLHDTHIHRQNKDLISDREHIKEIINDKIENPYEQTTYSKNDKQYIDLDIKYRPSIKLISVVKQRRQLKKSGLKHEVKKTQLYSIEEVDYSLTDSILTLFYPLRSYERNLEKIRLLTHESGITLINEDYYKQKLYDFALIHEKEWKEKFLEKDTTDKDTTDKHTRISIYLHSISKTLKEQMIYIDVGCSDGFYADAVGRIINTRHPNSLIDTNKYYNISNTQPLYFGIDIIKSEQVHKLQKGYVYLTPFNFIYLKAQRLTEPNVHLEEYYNIDNQLGRNVRDVMYGHFITCVNYFHRFNKSSHVNALINIAFMVKKGGLLYIQDYDVHPNDSDYGNVISKYLHINVKNFTYRGLILFVLDTLGFELVEEYTSLTNNFTNEFRMLFVNKRLTHSIDTFGEYMCDINGSIFTAKDVYSKYILPKLNANTFDVLRNYMITVSKTMVDMDKYQNYTRYMNELQNAETKSAIANVEMSYEEFITDMNKYNETFDRVFDGGVILHNTYQVITDYYKHAQHTIKYSDLKYEPQNILSTTSYSFHYGQLKLLISELMILMEEQYLENIDYIIYVGSAPGNHLPIIHELFKNKKKPIKFILYDGAQFDKSVYLNSQTHGLDNYIEIPNVNICTHKGDLFDDDALNDMKRRIKLSETDERYVNINKTLFVSDIRNESYGSVKKSIPDEEAIIIDMLLQQYWVEELRPRYSLFKFRLPWNDSYVTNVIHNVRNLLIASSIIPESMKTDKYLKEYDEMFKNETIYDEFGSSTTRLKYSYLDGELYLQAYPRVKTKETRLFVDREKHDYTRIMRDCKDYELHMQSHNIYNRRLCYNTKLTREKEIEGCCSCYDCKTFDTVCYKIYNMQQYEVSRFKSFRNMKKYIVNYLANDARDKHYFIRRYIYNLSKTKEKSPKLLTRELNMLQLEIYNYVNTKEPELQNIPQTDDTDDDDTVRIGGATDDTFITEGDTDITEGDDTDITEGDLGVTDTVITEGDTDITEGDTDTDTVITVYDDDDDDFNIGGGMDTIKNIKCILFDWGGTLAKPKMRDVFISGTPAEKRRTLWDDTIDTLNYLRTKDIKMGIISNTSFDTDDLRKALRDIDMDKYFDTQVYSSETGMCKKKCKYVFESVIDELGVKPQECIYVGDNYDKDVIGALRVGILPIHLNKHMKEDISYDKNGVLEIKHLDVLKDLIV